MSQFHLVLFIHAHQPIGNFDDVLERAYQRCYLPFIESLERHPAIRPALHYSGPLLEWLAAKHPEFFPRLKELVTRGQAELLGGGFYEPILIAIPPEDRLEQLRRMADHLEKQFGRRPRGAWLAERVWEPQLPAALAPGGVEYTLVDDLHFLAAGFEPRHLHGFYLAEDCGRAVKVFAGLKALRYLIPFRSVEETLDFLRQAAEESPGGFAAFGDDCEKFGVWPGTYEHCYRAGWLERFFAALEGSADWLRVTLPSEYLAANASLGRADLPAAAYPEMMEWALPTPARQRFAALQREFGSRPDALIFLRGGIWRSFLSKYAEANLLHKKMLHVSEKIRRLARRRRPAWPSGRKLARATTHLLRAQCNDAYWHGVFGGLYAPHLRAAVWNELVAAETLADAIEHRRREYGHLARLDFDADGAEELYIVSPRLAALLKPADGGTLAALDFRPAGITLINSIQRRPEAYHACLSEAASGTSSAVASIHGQTRATEEGLERRLRYDRWARHAFRLLLFGSFKRYGDYEALRLEESATFAGGAYKVVSASADKVVLACEATLSASLTAAPADGQLRAIKTLSFAKSAGGFELGCQVELLSNGPGSLKIAIGLEVVLNLLAADEPDRYFQVAGDRHPLAWGGDVPVAELRVVDEWQGVAVTLDAPGAERFWIAPIETVSESEKGFERVYQGSQILPIWPVEISSGAMWAGKVTLRVLPSR